MTTTSESLSRDDIHLLEEAADGFRKLKSEMGKVIVGQDAIIRPLLGAVFCQGHALVIGVPGLAKTLMVKTLAQALGWTFKRIQFTPDMMPADIIGIELLNVDAVSGERSMRFVPGPVFANIILADEINRTPPKTQSALLEAMQEYTVTSMGTTHPLERPFLVFATQNPIEQEGTYPLPEAQLDRFMFSLWIDYPSKKEEEDIVLATTDPREISVVPIFSRERMMEFQSLVRRIPVSRHIVSYAVSLARASRPVDADAGSYVREYVEWGAGPRASQHLILAGKAMAALDARPTVSAEHIRQIAPFVLRHRIMPNYNAAGEDISAADIVKHILADTAEPMYAVA
ncbi:MAG: AAA family ATPase [Phycisphaerales bacterium]